MAGSVYRHDLHSADDTVHRGHDRSAQHCQFADMQFKGNQAAPGDCRDNLALRHNPLDASVAPKHDKRSDTVIVHKFGGILNARVFGDGNYVVTLGFDYLLNTHGFPFSCWIGAMPSSSTLASSLRS